VSVEDEVRRTRIGTPPAPVRTVPSAPPDVAITAGKRIHQYELIRELGRGGMGLVWAARDLRLGRRVAMKFLFNASREIADRFLIEARATAQCSHENIVIIHEVDQFDDLPYMVLEFLEGGTLRELMGKPLPPSRVVELALPIARALERAHALAIVHRDLKPENVLVTTAGQVKVLDFGIAKARGATDELDGMAPSGHLAQTHAGTLVGTLPYMSPEQFGMDEVDERTDIWALGIMLYEMLSGRHPLAPLTTAKLMDNATSHDPMPSSRKVPGAPEALSTLVDRCLRKLKAERPASAEIVKHLEQLQPGRRGRALAEGESPYPGLAAFQETDADRFFGRSRDVARMVARMRDLPLTGVIGPSGAGKSSFVRAGVGPALKASGEPWEVLTLRPGRKPLAALAAAAGDPSLEQRLRTEPGALGMHLRARSARVVLFVDQLEELYTLVPEAAERRAFVAALAGVADDASAPLRVVVSMRSDFLDRVAEVPEFADELSSGLVFLASPDRAGLREVLVAPVEMVGYRFESATMIEDMLDALEGAHGALPLLQFAAAKLWDARDRAQHLLTVASYEAIGGITGALAVHADEVIASMHLEEQRLTRKIFRRLVTPERTRASVELSDLHELGPARTDVARVVERLVAARLLVVQTRGDAGRTVEIVHESLIERWPTLRRWLDEDQEDTAFLNQLAAAAKQWDTKGRPQGLLWRAEAMDEARRWFALRPRQLADRDRAFLDAVFALARRGQRAKRAALVGAFVVLGGVAVGAGIAYVQVRSAEQSASENLAREQEAHAKLQKEKAEREKADAQKVAAERDKDAAEREKATAEREKASAQRETQRVEQDSQKALQAQNTQLQSALAEARAATAKAEQATGEVRKAKADLQKEVAAKTARINELETEKKKLVTTLKQ
jgi:serine/threonine protein kinase